jgi:squalene-hopene/tetraprenyl-beta-curcumene cyclase
MTDVASTLARARQRLLSERGEHGHWVGELSTSALSTATAVAALALAERKRPADAARLAPLVDGGRAWLAAHANADGGYGDTVDSPTNVSTTALAWMALGVETGRSATEAEERARAGAEAWLRDFLGGLDARLLAEGLGRVYGEDRTFAVPILTACAIGGCFDEREAWRHVTALPFELAALPRGLFASLGLPVVSYALPALIAIGQAIHHHRPSRNPFARLARGATRAHTLAVLTRIQPENGGFLEATPLTSFVAQSLLASGQEAHPVVDRALDFLAASVRPDGSWPIDTNLATWVTTLSIGALSGGGALEDHLDPEERSRLRAWLLGQQGRSVHPYTGAAPGGWAWTDLPGGVPDADDTPGALLALAALADEDGPDAAVTSAAAAGVTWLVDLQNRDGGIPTFCRGWGKLPFDKSCPDLTAHALRAWDAWFDYVPAELGGRIDTASARARQHLVATQRSDGSWVPLWFGNQEEAHLENPLYGTSRVLRAAGTLDEGPEWTAALRRALDWLLRAQNEDGGFGGAPGVASSIEETALALEALCDASRAGLRPMNELRPAIDRAAGWLRAATNGGSEFPARPIGLYFARLWYSERLYPLAFTVSALERAAAL